MPTKKYILVFDLDNTLILRDEAMLHCIEHVFKMSLSNAQKLAIRKKDGQGHFNRIHFCEWLKSFLNIPLETSQIWKLIRSNIGFHVKLQEETIALLEALHAKYELVLFTNGGIENQRRKIVQTGLVRFFKEEHIFISEALGFKKPDPKAFEIVQKYFPTNSQFCMIGDHWENDILGAVNFGWQAVYLSSEDRKEAYINVVCISSLEELHPENVERMFDK